MNSMFASVKNFVSRLTLFSWIIIAAVVALIIIMIVVIASPKDQTNTYEEPIIDESTGLIENVEETEPVTEDENATGEILPENELDEQEVDYEADELGPPIE